MNIANSAVTAVNPNVAYAVTLCVGCAGGRLGVFASYIRGRWRRGLLNNERPLFRAEQVEQAILGNG